MNVFRSNTKDSTNDSRACSLAASCTSYWLRISACGAIVILIGFVGSVQGNEPTVSFPRDILPILSQNCFACHGPDEDHREAGLRLDVRDDAVDAGAIAPESPDESELLRRVTSADPDERMPPGEHQKPLSPEQIQSLRQWIAAGAKYEQHWAFVAPVRPSEPAVRDNSWAQNPLDRFVLAKLEQHQLTPSRPADPYTLVRRLYLDLTGLPPSIEQADAFVNSEDPQAYEQLVDHLLNSPQYGVRWARWWLDMARYADTNGYEKDRPRSIWPYRDWVVQALNDDLPFDQFSIEQLAGDMLPNATAAQRIATGFHRNTMLNEEGGIDPLEFRFYAMVDRIATTGTIWMGLTVGCAQCHTHKYDPINHREFYELMAYLDNADEPDLIVRDASVSMRRDEISARLEDVYAQLITQYPLPADADASNRSEAEVEALRREQFERALDLWIGDRSRALSDWKTMRPVAMQTNLPKLELLDDGSVFSSGDITKRDVYTMEFDLSPEPLTALRLEVLPDDRLPARGPGRCYYEGRKGDFFLSEVVATIDGQPIKFARAEHTYGKNGLGSGSADAQNVLDGEGSTGWSTAEREGERHALLLVPAEPLPASGHMRLEMVFERHYAASLGRFRWSSTSENGDHHLLDLPVDVEAALRLAKGQEGVLSEGPARDIVRQHFLSVCPELKDARQSMNALRTSLPSFPTTMVFQERASDNPRPTFRHHRGEYLSPREAVHASLPEVFAHLTPKSPTNRLEFARWLVSDANPLAARVTVNRIWRSYFGYGLVRTNGDYGTQSEPPTHPELLDWLACEFQDNGWSLKKLHRLIVTSSTYRQSSAITPELREFDPENRWLARGGRFRMDGEIVRDSMLASSGKLSLKMGGPSVFPPQPQSVMALSYDGFGWNASGGEDRYRRSLYTFAKRTTPFAAYTVFDGPTGENCLPRRDRSNTPLQSLTLLNDPMYAELAVELAKRSIAEVATAGSSTDESSSIDERIAMRMFRHLLTRPPNPQELKDLLKYYETQQSRITSGELDAATLCGTADASADWGAWTLTARAIMNLDEAITRE